MGKPVMDVLKKYRLTQDEQVRAEWAALSDATKLWEGETRNTIEGSIESGVAV